MAIYTYECSTCGRRWDENRKMTDPELDIAKGVGCCASPDGSATGRRVWVASDFRAVFKGRGWARKDHKDASKP